MSASNPSGRELLPTHVFPQHYHVTLEPDFTKFTFEGTVVIDLKVVEDCSSISLHKLEIDIHSSTVQSNGTAIGSAPIITYDETTQFCKFDLGDAVLKEGSTAQLTVVFTGQLNDQMSGFYRSTYRSLEDGSEGILATTHFEPIGARKAFPCFDEPLLKAKFTVTLIADKDLTCLSNMDVASEVDHGSKRAVTFNQSPLMSTYLVAFIIGHLNYVESRDFRLPLRVYAPPSSNIEDGRFAVDLAAKALTLYEKSFGIEFPLPKLDQVAIPDFAIGGMENWGVVMYRTTCLMYGAADSVGAKSMVAEVVLHELAHQWFGNLVTMDWWEGLWLKEGFATWASWYSCNTFYPEWKVWQTYVTEDLQRALDLDSLRSSHPIEVPVKRASEVSQIFDAISYSKGACVLRMLSVYLGEETFLEGVRRYLKKHAYGNAQTDDLWASLAEASQKPVSEIMTVWTKNVGFPIVKVSESDSGLKIQQNRFLKTADVSPEEDQILYPAFLALRTKEGIDSSLMLHDRETTIPNPGEFFKINADHPGIYRTLYTPSRLDKLGQAAKQGLLSVEDKAGLIADAFALATAGYQKTPDAIDLLGHFSTETEYAVWNQIFTSFNLVRSTFIFEDSVLTDGLKAFARDLISPVVQKVGWSFSATDSHRDQQLKTTLFINAVASGDETTISAAKEIFARHLAGDPVHPNLRRAVFSVAAKHGGSKEYEELRTIYRTSQNEGERLTALGSLGRSEDPQRIKETLDMALSAEVKDQDIFTALFGLRDHRLGIEALFTWLTSNWEAISARYPPGLSTRGDIVQMACRGFTTTAHLTQVTAFFDTKDTSSFDQALAQTKDTIASKAAWLERDAADVQAWIKTKKL